MEASATTSPPAAYSIPEAAERLRVSRSQLYRLMSAGALRTVKLGARRIVPAAEITRLLAKGSDR